MINHVETVYQMLENLIEASETDRWVQLGVVIDYILEHCQDEMFDSPHMTVELVVYSLRFLRKHKLFPTVRVICRKRKSMAGFSPNQAKQEALEEMVKTGKIPDRLENELGRRVREARQTFRNQQPVVEITKRTFIFAPTHIPRLNDIKFSCWKDFLHIFTAALQYYYQEFQI